MTDCYWSLYNTIDQVRVDGLRTVQIHALMKSLARNSIQEWLVWQEGTSEWRPAVDILKDFNADENAASLPALPPHAPSTKSDEPESSSDDEAWQDEEGAKVVVVDQRTNARYLHQFKVLIEVNNRSIMNETVDISMGGMKLRDPLPKTMRGSFQVTLVNNKTELLMRCRGVQTKEEPELKRLLIENCSRLDVLRSWILKVRG